MTTMQWIGLAVGALILVARLPGIAWPGAYRRVALGVLERHAHVARAIGAVLWVIAVSILVLVARTLTILQVVMLTIAVLFVIVGVVMVLFPDAYRAFARRILERLPDAGIRIASAAAVALGLWIVYLSLSVR